MIGRSWLWAFSFTLPLVACAGDAVTPGALEQASINVACPTEEGCVREAVDAPLAVGARLPLDVTLTVPGSAAPLVTLHSANADVFDVDKGAIRARGPGVASLLLLTDQATVVDTVALWVAAATTLKMQRKRDSGIDPLALPGKIQLVVGDDLVFAAVPYQGDRRLLGTLDAAFSVEGGGVKLVDQGVPDARRVLARAPGTVKLIARAASLETSLELEVIQ